nr:26.5 kDa glutathione transferase recombinant protein [synthetic construct]
MNKYKFAYWNLRGLGQPIRLILEFISVPYEEKRFQAAEKEQWFAEKYDLGFDFPNLPYLIDGDKKITQSHVITMYLGKKHGLAGDNDDDLIMIAMAEGGIKDLRQGISKIALNPDYEKLRPDFMPTFFKGLETISNFLGNKKYLIGDRLCYADFVLYENLDVFEIFEPKCLDKFPNLKRFKREFESLPKIKAYLESDRCIKWPLNNWIAKFGGGFEPPKKR